MATPSLFPRPLTGDDVIDAATSGYYWELDITRTVNWSLADGFFGDSWIFQSNFVAISDSLSSIFENISSYANVQFNNVGYYTDPIVADVIGGSDITVSLDDGLGWPFFSDPSTLAIGHFPNAANTAIYQGQPGDIFLNLNSDATLFPYAPGSEGYWLLLHEIGHTLGLKHPHDDGGTGFPTFQELGWGTFDKDMYTVMSYNDDHDNFAFISDPATPMVLDVLALQYLYGKNNTTNATDSTHTLLQNYMYQTIWDAGGIDVVDVSQSAVGWEIQLPTQNSALYSVLVDTKIGSARPASETALSSPFTLYWLMGDIENVTGSSFDDTLVGNDFSNSLIGNAGNDTIYGFAGNDEIAGGDGNDHLEGGEGNDRFDWDSASRAGADTFLGGAGDDVYVISGNDQVVENSAEGTDLVWASENFSIEFVPNVENLSLFSTDPVSATGNSLNNRLTGNSAANMLTGGLGDDTYFVGVGDTVVEAANEGTDTVQSDVTWTLGAHLENLTLTGIGAINGTGNALNNVIVGNENNNVLDGGAGEDSLWGHLGNDTYVVGTGDTVVEAANEGTDVVRSSVSFTLSNNVENLTLTGTGAINGTGNSLNNTLTGNSGANVLTGGAGHDTYIVGAGDTVVENAAEGTDLVQSSVSFTVGDNVEKLTLTGTAAIDGTGNSLSNTLTGNSGANVITGATGNDTMIGGLGNDTYMVDRSEGRDTISENDGTGGNSDLLLYGATINPLDLVLSRQVNDLRLAIHGSTDYVTIQNWYSAPSTAQVETIQAGNGQSLINTEVDQLIQAMATFSQQTGLTWDQAIDQQPQQVQTVLAASW